MGTITLAEALAERERIQGQLQAALDENTGRWGGKGTGRCCQRNRPSNRCEAGHGAGEVSRGN